LVNVNGDLFGTTLSRYMLSARQLRSATIAREADQILSYQRHGPPRASATAIAPGSDPWPSRCRSAAPTLRPSSTALATCRGVARRLRR
jgi:hypothetical protein